ncbi:MAG: hypothetical protein JWQ89_3591 [Devosia sp.]|uniref:PIN-like domain-containing protein n=1 Tax=Devosia sp. TaxID=1871048 RepID=UPI00261C81B1|nr:hypothetical protein [Devosia sp.]MDB5541864.1 hypothetical protein [Devosia sp.]
MKLLIDNNLSPKVARAIHQLIVGDGDLAVPLRDKFDHSISDLDWIAALATEGGWSVVSGDHRITKNRIERAAWLQTNLIGFFLEPSLARLDPLNQTARLIFWIPILRRQLSLIRGPALFALPLKATSKLRQL